MKRFIIAVILCIPCVLVLNDSDTFIPNLFGSAYGYMLYWLANNTSKGRKFVKELSNSIK